MHYVNKRKTSEQAFDPYDHIGFLTNRIGRLLANHMSEKIEDQGLKFPSSCIGILADLWATDGVNQTELGSSLIKTKSSINKMLTALESDGLITKENDPNDKRGKLIFLTARGKAMQNEIESASTCCDQQILEEVSESDLKITKRVLAKYYERLLQQRHNEINK